MSSGVISVDQIIPSVETLTGGTADRFHLSGGPGVPIVEETAAQVKTRLGQGTMAAKSTYVIQIALSGYDQAVSSGTKKGQCRVPFAGTITGFLITCDPANEPSAAAIQCDLKTVNLSTGALTSVLTSVASIATGTNVSTGGAISGSPGVSAGDQLAVDIDQGSDGKGLVATVTITAT